MYLANLNFSDSMMTAFKVLTFLIIISCYMVTLIFAHRLSKDELTDRSQEKDLDLETIKHEDNPHAMTMDIPYPRAASHLSQKKDLHFHPSRQEAIKKQKQSGQVTGTTDVFASKADFSMNSYPTKSLFSKDNEKTSPQKQIPNNSDNVYAFCAFLSSITEVSEGSVIIFDYVPVNEGKMYFNTTGYFMCPDSDVYVFVWTVLMAEGSRSRCLTSLKIGGEEIKKGPKTSYNPGVYSGTSQMTAVVQCRSSPLTGIAVASDINPAPTFAGLAPTFSGFRLASIKSAVGFTAELSVDTPLFPGGRIMFDKVITNFGGMYKAEQGYFECPDNGTYSFTVTTHFPNCKNQWSVSKLVFGGETILHGPMTYWATEADDSGSSSVTVVAQCQQGKAFYVEAKEAYTFPHNMYGAGLTSFTGAKLCYNDCDDYVAFSAVLADNITSPGPVTFGHVLLNQGNAYNKSNGTFTCPDNKLYLFTWSGTAIFAESALVLYLNDSLNYTVGVNYLQVTGNSSDSRGTSGTCSQNAIFRCSTGTTVNVYYLYLTESASPLLADYSVFSGYLIPNQ